MSPTRIQSNPQRTIVTKFHPAKGAIRNDRVSASWEDGRLFVNYDGSLSDEENHKAAVTALMQKENWGGQLVCGSLPDGKYAWTMATEASLITLPGVAERSAGETSRRTAAA